MKAMDTEPRSIEELTAELEKVRKNLPRLLEGHSPGLTDPQLYPFLEQVPVGIFIVDHEGRPCYANQASQRVLGRGINPGAGPEDLAETYHVYIAGTDSLYPTTRL